VIVDDFDIEAMAIARNLTIPRIEGYNASPDDVLGVASD